MNNYFKIIFTLFIILNSSFLIGQHADCDNLLVLEDTIYHSGSISGFGTTKEFDGNNLDDKKTFEKEANSIWYLIKAPESGIFTFDIVTENENDDWDFLLYQHKTTFCKRIKESKIKPIRSNLSRSPITGLSESATESFMSAGVNSNYSKSIQVTRGDEFVLVVNNPKRSGGKHTLILHFPKKKIIEKIVEEKQPANTTLFKMEIKDAKTKQPITGYASVYDLQRKVIELDEVANYENLVSKKNRKVTIEAYAKGYMLVSKEYKTSKSRSNCLAEVLLEKIEPGKKVNLTNIQFYGDKFNVLPTAKPSLKALLLFMERNPTVKIEIEGHVNGPGNRNTKAYKELSYNRAYTVKAHLIKNGILKDRVDFKGYGNSQMLYPKPKSLYQESANRRVEIKILSK